MNRVNHSARLRTLRARLDEADRALRVARGVFNATRDAYDGRRRYVPGGAETERARAAWAMAGHEWIRALITRETVRDQLAAERRDVDQAATEGPVTPSTTLRRGC